MLGLLYAIVTTGAAVGRLVFSVLPSLSELFLADVGSDSLHGVVFPIDVKIIPSGKKVLFLRASTRTSRSDFSNDGFPVQKVCTAAKKDLFLVCSESFVSVPPLICEEILSILVASDSTTLHVSCCFISADFCLFDTSSLFKMNLAITVQALLVCVLLQDSEFEL